MHGEHSAKGPIDQADSICCNLDTSSKKRKGFAMTTQTRRALDSLSESIQRNTPQIEEMLRKAGVNPDAALVYSAAKYFEALNKLAAK